MSNVFCLDITEMAPSVAAFQLVHKFGLHEVCFPTIWVQNQKSLRLQIKEKNVKETKHILSPESKNCMFT